MTPEEHAYFLAATWRPKSNPIPPFHFVDFWLGCLVDESRLRGACAPC